MCTESNYFKVDMKTCEYVWTNTDFWKQWDQEVDAGKKGCYDSATVFPDIYRILCVTVLGSMISWIMCLMSWFKEEYVSRWVTQLICAIFAFSSFCYLYCTIASSSSVLVEADKWAIYYESQNIACSKTDEGNRSGTKVTAAALIFNLVIYVMRAMPTCFNTCDYIARDGADFEAARSISQGYKSSDADDTSLLPPMCRL